jgi:hypothetical protein
MLTYFGLLEQLPPLPSQDPQCEGDKKHCVLFTTRSPHKGPHFRVARAAGGVVNVCAGYAQGVALGTEFQLYADANSSSSLGVFRATSVTSTSSILSPVGQANISRVSNQTYALVAKWNNNDARLKVCIKDPASSAIQPETIKQKMSVDHHAAQVGITWISTPCGADIVLHDRDEGRNVGLERVDDLIGRYAARHLKIRPDLVVHTLHSAAHFKFHLARAKMSHPPVDRLAMELYRLKRHNFSGHHTPIGDDLIQDGRARIVVSNEPYGITLRNDSTHDYFPSLFYFDPSDYSIQPWYLPPSSTMSAPLRHGSKLTVGHGNHDAHVIKFSLKPGEHSDTGFLVLYLSSGHADMSHIKHSGASESARGATLEMLDRDYWGAFYTVITVTRRVDELSNASGIPLANAGVQLADPPMSTMRLHSP